MNKNIISTGILFALTAVILGALNAHYLKTIFSEDLRQSFDTGVKYQMFHALALIIFGYNASHFVLKNQKVLHLLFSLGIICFSFSIYLLCYFKSQNIVSSKFIGILTPIGGLIFILSWLYFLRILWKTKKSV